LSIGLSVYPDHTSRGPFEHWGISESMTRITAQRELY
jgi:hypothetical protein